MRGLSGPGECLVFACLGGPALLLGPDTTPRHSHPPTPPNSEKMPGFVSVVQATRSLCIGIQLMSPDAPIIFTEQ